MGSFERIYDQLHDSEALARIKSRGFNFEGSDEDFVRVGEPIEWAKIIRDLLVENNGAGSNQDNPFGYTYDGLEYVTRRPVAILDAPKPLSVYAHSSQRKMEIRGQYTGLSVGLGTVEQAMANPPLFMAVDDRYRSGMGPIDVTMSPLLSNPEDATASWQLVVGDVMKVVIENIRLEREAGVTGS